MLGGGRGPEDLRFERNGLTVGRKVFLAFGLSSIVLARIM